MLLSMDTTNGTVDLRLMHRGYLRGTCLWAQDYGVLPCINAYDHCMLLRIGVRKATHGGSLVRRVFGVPVRGLFGRKRNALGWILGLKFVFLRST